jgi:hypothetical protein
MPTLYPTLAVARLVLNIGFLLSLVEVGIKTSYIVV